MNETTNISKLIDRLVEAKAETMKLGLDVHARNVVVCVQVDGARPMRPRKMSAGELLALVRGLVAAECKVYACYEAGPCGYGLYRDLAAAGASAYVVVAESLSDARRQKTDGLDATGLADWLDRYVRGNTKAFTVVRVPSIEEENLRQEGRLREQLKKSRQQWEARGRSLLLFKGRHVCGPWWKQRRWEKLRPELCEFLVKELEVMRTVLLEISVLEQARKKQLEETAPKALPKAFGALTWVMLAREIGSWHRFKNRRQAASYTGLCPGVHQSGQRRKDGSINRYGNPRVRMLLIELVWRLVRWQPDYPPVRRLRERLVTGAARRKEAVAAARRLSVDLWRLATGQTTAEKLKLIVPSEVLPQTMAQ